MTAFNAAQWREDILEAVDDCNHRCLPWQEQHRRVERLVEKLRAEVRGEAIRSAAAFCFAVAKEIDVSGDGDVLKRAGVEIAADTIKKLGVAILATAIEPAPLPPPNVPAGNPAEE